MSLSQYIFYPTLTPARVVATTNIVGNYNNGPSNNGIGATLTAPSAAVLTIDSVNVVLGDRVLLIGQSASSQNGIYIVTTQGTASIAWVLLRTEDFQSPNQLRAGMSLSIGAGSSFKGSLYELVEPLPLNFGVDAINFVPSTLQLVLGTAASKAASDNTKSTVASISGAILANHIAQFADTAGTIQDGGVLGNAASKTVSNVSLATVASVSGATVANHLPFFNDTTGTIVDSGTRVTAGNFSFAGGATSVDIPVAVVTSSSVVIANKTSTTNASYVNFVFPSSGNITVFFNVDPGACTISWMAFTVAV